LRRPDFQPTKCGAGEPLTLTVFPARRRQSWPVDAAPGPVLRAIGQSFPARRRKPAGFPLSSSAGAAGFSYTLIPLSDRIKFTPRDPILLLRSRNENLRGPHHPTGGLDGGKPGTGGAPRRLRQRRTSPIPPPTNRAAKGSLCLRVFVRNTRRRGRQASIRCNSAGGFSRLQTGRPPALLGGLWAWDRRREFSWKSIPMSGSKRQARRGIAP